VIAAVVSDMLRKYKTDWWQHAEIEAKMMIRCVHGTLECLERLVLVLHGTLDTVWTIKTTVVPYLYVCVYAGFSALHIWNCIIIFHAMSYELCKTQEKSEVDTKICIMFTLACSLIKCFLLIK
jgi:hypothetical protein